VEAVVRSEFPGCPDRHFLAKFLAGQGANGAFTYFDRDVADVPPTAIR
jgi:hypothetical protein